MCIRDRTKDSFGNLSQSLDSTVNLEENPMTALITLAQQDSDGNAITWTFSEDGERNNITAITGTGYNKTISGVVQEIEKDSWGLPSNEYISQENLIKVYTNDDVAFTYFDSDDIPYRTSQFSGDALDERRLSFTVKYSGMDIIIQEYNSLKVLDLISIGSPLVQLLRKITSSGTNPTDLQFSSSGEKAFFLLPAASSQVLYQQPLTTGFNIATLQKANSTNDRFEFSEQEVQTGRGIQFNSTGKKAYVLEDRNNYTVLGQTLKYNGNARIIEYDLADSFDVTTITNNSPNLRNRLIGTETFFGEGDSGGQFLYTLQQRWDQIQDTQSRSITFGNASRLNRLTLDIPKTAISARDQSTLKSVELPVYVQTYSTHGYATQTQRNNGAYDFWWNGTAFPGDPTGIYAADGVTWLSVQDQGIPILSGRSGWPQTWYQYGGFLHWSYNWHYYWMFAYYGVTPITRFEHRGAPISIHLSKNGEHLYYITQIAADKGVLARAKLPTRWDPSSINIGSTEYTLGDDDSDGVTNYQNLQHTIGVSHAVTQSRPYKDKGVYGLTLNPDCNKVYILDTNTHAVYQYNMTASHDLASLGTNRTTLSTNPLSIDPTGFDAKLSLSAIPVVSGGADLQAKLNRIVDVYNYQSNVKDFLDESLIRNIQFNKDGTKFYVMNDVDIFEYGLSTAYDISTATFTKSTDRYKFKTEGKSLNTSGLVRVERHASIYQTPYGEETNYSFSSVNLQDSGDRPGSQRMYYRDSDNILLVSTDDIVYQFSTDSIGNGTQPLDTIRILGDSFQSPGGIALNDSNNRIYISDVNKIHRLDLATPEKIFTAGGGGSTLIEANNISGLSLIHI